MTTWVLIFYILFSGKAVTVAPHLYPTEQQCQTAATEAAKRSKEWLNAVCVPGPQMF